MVSAYDTRKALRKVPLCKKHSVPFEEAFNVSTVMQCIGPPNVKLLEEVERVAGEEVGTYRKLAEGWDDIEEEGFQQNVVR